ncbi:hypothetical protein DSO57_1007944 [Entomophthora muscae]|uniref:Uncharacterized protein n=1 Tax=Entomophthora muscae TaxID=34485 RepID=A0ACC2SW73_9FUNG|nr:hypothetical protein DSO57_1007944 [Entomophthora muscae]
MDMEPPVTPKPMPASATELPLDHTNKLFGIVYITLTGVIDTIVPATGPWLWVGKSMSYLIKLAPILWWALPTQSVTRQFPNTSDSASQGWFPDTIDQRTPPSKLIVTFFGFHSCCLILSLPSINSVQDHLAPRPQIPVLQTYCHLLNKVQDHLAPRPQIPVLQTYCHLLNKVQDHLAPRPQIPVLQTYCHLLNKGYIFWLPQLLPYSIFAIYQFSTRSSGPPPSDPCPPGVPFGPVHFTEYPLKPKYKEYTPEKILELDPLAHMKSARQVQLPACLQTPYGTACDPQANARLPRPTDHTSKLFGIVYITLTGVVDTIILDAGLWSWVGKSFSYLFRLAPLLWWALLVKSLAGMILENAGLAAQAWIPDIWAWGLALPVANGLLGMSDFCKVSQSGQPFGMLWIGLAEKIFGLGTWLG